MMKIISEDFIRMEGCSQKGRGLLFGLGGGGSSDERIIYFLIIILIKQFAC